MSKTDSFDLKFTFDKHRVFRMKDRNGSVTSDKSAGRIGLGFEKLQQLIALTDFHPESVIMNIFGGPGNLIRLCSVQRCRLLFALDLYYYSSLSDLGWEYDIDHQFDEWEHDLPTGWQYRRPLFLGRNIQATNLLEFKSSIDVLFVDPPFGRDTNSYLSMNADLGQRVFASAVSKAPEVLANNGTFAFVVPPEWSTFVSSVVEREFGHKPTWHALCGSKSVLAGIARKVGRSR
jgi:hypothetical protein